MKRFGFPVLVCAFVLTLAGFAQAQPEREVVFQTSTIDALLSGIYEGKVTYGQLKMRGDFGIGTFNELDGEMIGFDGKFYQITADGNAHLVADALMTPFAAVTFFERDRVFFIDKDLDLAQLQAYLDGVLPSKNLFYAIRIEGTFKYIKTRSVPRQSKPYRKLVEVVATQPTFEFKDVKGTIVGFRCPYFVKGANVPGYHFHFLDEAKARGGHVLDCRLQSVSAALDITPGFRLYLPDGDEFLRRDFEGGNEKELEKVEQGR